jgi:hypothetical protein
MHTKSTLRVVAKRTFIQRELRSKVHVLTVITSISFSVLVPLFNLMPDKENNLDADVLRQLILAGILNTANGHIIAITIVRNVMQENNLVWEQPLAAPRNGMARTGQV